MTFLLMLSGMLRAQPMTISTSKRVLGLQWDGTQQTASFTFTATVGAGLPAPRGYSWSVDGATSVFTATNTFSYSVHTPGKHTIKVDTPAPDYPASLTFAAIGGPLTPGVVKSSVPNVPARDSISVTAPWYLQYFETGEQIAQGGQVTVALSQPTGTWFEWSLTNSCVSFLPYVDLQHNVHPQFLTLDKSDAGTIRAICNFHYTDPNDSSLTGTTQDDSLQTPPSGTTLNPAYYTFTSHMPKIIYDTSGPSEGSYPGVWQMKLSDHLFYLMPGVWVQERFTPPFVDGSGKPILNQNNVQLGTDNWVTDGFGMISDAATGTQEIGDTWNDTGLFPYYDAAPNSPVTKTQNWYAGTRISDPASTIGVLVGYRGALLWGDYFKRTGGN